MEPRCRSHYNNGSNRLLLSELRVISASFLGKILTETRKTNRRKRRESILGPDFSLQRQENHPCRPAVAAKILIFSFRCADCGWNLPVCVIQRFQSPRQMCWLCLVGGLGPRFCRPGSTLTSVLPCHDFLCLIAEMWQNPCSCAHDTLLDPPLQMFLFFHPV